jgi:hypothetical protein
MRIIALSLLLTISCSIVLPAFAPTSAYAAAAEGTTVQTLPSLPWRQIGQWLLKNALTLLMLAEEIWRDATGGNDNPPAETPPQPPHAAMEAG